MKITHDKRANAIYIHLTDGKFHHNQVINDDVILDIDADGAVIGIELLGVSDWVSEPDEFKFQDITPHIPASTAKNK